MNLTNRNNNQKQKSKAAVSTNIIVEDESQQVTSMQMPNNEKKMYDLIKILGTSEDPSKYLRQLTRSERTQIFLRLRKHANLMSNQNSDQNMMKYSVDP